MAHDLRTPWPPEYRRNLKRKNSYSFAALLWGTRGDVQPFIALGAELVRRGHRALVAAREPYRALAAEQGIDFFPMPEDGTEEFMKAMAGAKGIPGMLSLSAAYSRRLLAEQFRLFEQAAREADVILTKAVSTAPAVHVAERRGIPAILVHVDPGFIPSETFCMAGDRFADMGTRMNRLMPRIMLAAFALTVADRINAWRIRRGLPPDRLARRNQAGHLFRFPALMAWSPFFLPPSPDWPQWYIQTGWWRPPRRRPPDARLREFVLSGPPPLYFGFGSWNVHEKAPLTEAVLGALRITGERAVLLGGTVERSAEYPPEVLVADTVPFDWLLPRVKAAVHHGGAGTTGAASMAGVPSLVVPAFDAQTPWGHLVAEKRVGTMLRRSELTAERLAAAIREVGEPGMRERARVVGILLRSEGGVEQAADEIERRLWEATQEPGKAVLRLAEVHPTFTSSEFIETLPSPDPLERPLAGGEPAAGDPFEEE